MPQIQLGPKMKISLLLACFTWTYANSKHYESGKVTAEQHLVRASANESATLSCHVQGNQLSNFKWLFEFEYLDVDFTPLGVTEYINESYVLMTLTLTDLSRQDHGTYRCEALDSVGRIGDEISLEVAIVPEVEIDSVEATGTRSVYLIWSIDNEFDHDYRTLIMYKKNGTEDWHRHSETIASEYDEKLLMGLENGTTYKFRVIATNSVGDSEPADSEWVTTWSKDFLPNVWINSTTLDSVSIGWSEPPEELGYGLLSYNVTAIRGDQIVFWQYVKYELCYTFIHLEPGTNYRFKVAACHSDTKLCGDWGAEENAVTMDRDPKFVPTLKIIKTSLDSITIEWSRPRPELQDRVHQYKVMMTHRNRKEEPIYLPKTVNLHVFENLESRTTYLIKVAACSDYKTQCSEWSPEQEVVTISIGGEIQYAIWPSVIVAIVLLIVMVIWMGIRKRHEQAARRRFIEATLDRFNGGALDCLDPELSMGDQAELLPYNKKWEYPRELLKLDKVLGSGAFGVVRKAQAKSICRSEAVTTVAVKMVRATARLDQMTALSRELKILAYLGKHLNVVNLLGACTKDVSYGELLVIVEFCRFGNLRDYLLQHRNDFVNEADTATGNFAEYSSSTDCKEGNHSGADTVCLKSDSTTDDCSKNLSLTDTTVTIDDRDASDANAVEVSLRTKYQGDYSDENLEAICTGDLLCWAWQVSRGMKYLGSRRILHGDLAARNILLADNNVVKICDFGLAKALCIDDNYKKKGHDPLPVKWMAIESLRDRIFSVRSDIWSYGIVLWEFFSLGETPYRGMPYETLCQRLIDGFRMARPKYATQDIYRMMMDCWKAEPAQRPPFEKLEERIASLLNENVKTYYFDLNAPYVQMNADVLDREEKDYLMIEPSKAVCDTIV